MSCQSSIYSGLEISGIRKKAGYCERDNSNPHFFSVYGRNQEDGLLVCLDDFYDYDEAVAYALELRSEQGIQIIDYFRMAHQGKSLFNIDSVNIKRCFRVRQTRYPMPEKDCRVMISKMTPYPGIRIELTPVLDSSI